jgi:hypothetical protein
VDFIKVHRRVPRDSYFALIDEAKKQGLTVVGHIPMTVTPEEASDAGQATIEHTETLFEGTFSAALKEGELPEAIRRFRTEGAGEKLFARFVENKTMVDPTLVAYRSIIESLDGTYAKDPHNRYVALSSKRGPETGQTGFAGRARRLEATFAEFREVVGQMNRSGVTLLAGTDIAGRGFPASACTTSWLCSLTRA